ncbi:MAG: NADH-quinone oxidoreductase subunit J [Acidimicrobiales bacterium]
MHPLAVLLGGPQLLGVTVPDGITFAAAAVMCLAGAFGVVLSRNPVHSALFLILTLFGVAVLFVEQDAQFLAAVQVIVYAGAIVVLFLFVIMLIGVDREERLAVEPLKGQRVIGALLGLLALAEVLLLARVSWPTGAPAVAGSASGPGTNVAKLGRSVFTTYLLPFEVTSVLLVIAVVGAVVLARRPGAARRPPDVPEEEPPAVDQDTQTGDGPTTDEEVAR